MEEGSTLKDISRPKTDWSVAKVVIVRCAYMAGHKYQEKELGLPNVTYLESTGEHASIQGMSTGLIYRILKESGLSLKDYDILLVSSLDFLVNKDAFCYLGFDHVKTNVAKENELKNKIRDKLRKIFSRTKVLHREILTEHPHLRIIWTLPHPINYANIDIAVDDKQRENLDNFKTHISIAQYINFIKLKRSWLKLMPDIPFIALTDLVISKEDSSSFLNGNAKLKWTEVTTGEYIGLGYSSNLESQIWKEIKRLYELDLKSIEAENKIRYKEIIEMHRVPSNHKRSGAFRREMLLYCENRRNIIAKLGINQRLFFLEEEYYYHYKNGGREKINEMLNVSTESEDHSEKFPHNNGNRKYENRNLYKHIKHRYNDRHQKVNPRERHNELDNNFKKHDNPFEWRRDFDTKDTMEYSKEDPKQNQNSYPLPLMGLNFEKDLSHPQPNSDDSRQKSFQNEGDRVFNDVHRPRDSNVRGSYSNQNNYDSFPNPNGPKSSSQNDFPDHNDQKRFRIQDRSCPEFSQSANSPSPFNQNDLRTFSNTGGPGSFPNQSGPASFSKQGGPGSFSNQSGPPSFPIQSGPESFQNQSTPRPFPNQSGPGSFPNQSDSGSFPNQSGSGSFQTQNTPRPFPNQRGLGSFQNPANPGSYQSQIGPGSFSNANLSGTRPNQNNSPQLPNDGSSPFSSISILLNSRFYSGDLRNPLISLEKEAQTMESQNRNASVLFQKKDNIYLIEHCLEELKEILQRNLGNFERSKLDKALKGCQYLARMGSSLGKGDACNTGTSSYNPGSGNCNQYRDSVAIDNSVKVNLPYGSLRSRILNN